jgi:hypothetical protein
VSGSVGQGIHTGVATIRTNSHMVRTWFAQIRTWFAEDSHKFAQQSQHSPRFTEIRANSHLVHTVAKFARIRTESQAFALPSHAVALTSHGVAQDSHKIRTKFAKIHTLFSPILTGRTCELVTPTHHVSHVCVWTIVGIQILAIVFTYVASTYDVLCSCTTPDCCARAPDPTDDPNGLDLTTVSST